MKKEDYKLYICEEKRLNIYYITIQKYINTLFKKSLTTLTSREKTTKIVFGFKSKIPIYVNQSILLMCIRSYRLEKSFYINYFAIKNYLRCKDYITIYFRTNHCMRIKEKHTFFTQLEKCHMIIDFLNHTKMLT